MSTRKFSDARIAPVAIGIWLGSASTVLVLLQRNFGWTVCYLITTLACLGMTFWLTRRQSAEFRFQIWILLSSISFGILIAGIRIATMFVNPTSELANDRMVVTAQVVVIGDPTQISSQGKLDWVSEEEIYLPVKVEWLQHNSQTQAVNASVLLFAAKHLNAFEDLVPGTKMQLTLHLQPSTAGSKYAASAQAIGTPQIIRGPPRYQWVASQIRNRLHDALVGQTPEAQALIPGLTLGDTRFLPNSLATQMRDAGLSHLIAVSGANVTILLAIIFTVLARFSRLIQFGTALLVLCGFVVIVRPQPSVLRAAVMGIVMLIGFVLGRKVDPIATLSVAVCTLVVIDPVLSASYGFALSVFATLGLIVGATKVTDSLNSKLPRRLPAWVVAALGVTLAAQFAVLPLLVLLGARISLATILTNLIAVPLASFVMICGLVLTAIAAVCLPVAKVLAVVVAVPAWLIGKVAQVGASLTFLSVPFPSGFAGICWALWLCVLVLLLSFRGANRTESQNNLIWSTLLLCVVALWWQPFAPVRPLAPDDWIVVSCDVGQGDASLINLGNHQAIVIDVGPDPNAIDACLHEFRVTTVPLLVITHFHADHVGGIAGIFRNRKVGSVRVSPLAEPEITHKFAQATFAQHHLTARPLVAGDKLRVGAVTLETLWPARLIRGQGSDPNNASIVLVTDIAGIKFVFAGDVEAPAQKAIVASGVLGQVDVLKIAHHGSRNQDQEFASKLSPRIGLISVGSDNDYGHPAPETVLMYETLGTKLFRTDQSGDIAIRAESGRLEVLTQH